MVLSSLAPGVAAEDAQEEIIEEIVVVGSQIRGADIAGSLPVSVLSEDDMVLTGAVTGDELLRSIPQMGFVGFNEAVTTGVNAARGDVNSINLRGLGTGNTLTLINGRRMVLHPGTQTENRIPVVTTNANTLPVMGLERLEVLRDGAAALYGTDAVAGVVNYVLKDDFEGTEFNVRYGLSEGTDLDETTINGATGFSFNDGRTRVMVSGTYYDKSGFAADERDYAETSDLRGEFAGDPLFAGDASLDNRSSLFLGWGEYIYEGDVGRVHVRPTDLVRDNGDLLSAADCDFLLPDQLCLDPGSSDRALRIDRNRTRELSPDSDRLNLFSYITHDFDNGYQWYTELGYYQAEVDRTREQAGLLSNGRFTVPADYYWNPLGPVTFADGRVNPNRVVPAGDPTVPDEGLPFVIRNFTAFDTGFRQVNVEDTSYRFVTGLQGTIGAWDFDTAVVYSEAETVDETDNRLSHTLFQQALLSDQPGAYNIFNGLDPADPASPFDPTPNPRASIDPFIISVKRESETSLTLVDFKVSNP
ncbi:MAG: TonB-dependent receptor plug domain-containing protein, partial [Pseudomonadota bacterium]